MYYLKATKERIEKCRKEEIDSLSEYGSQIFMERFLISDIRENETIYTTVKIKSQI
jgi:hypothetical protein